VEYKILSEEHRSQLRQEISLRIPAKREAEIKKLLRKRKASQEALVQRLVEEQEEETFWNSSEVLAEVAKVEVAHLEGTANPPSQDLVVLASPGSGVPPIQPIESGRTPSRVKISAEELALIVSFRQALDRKERINWQAYLGLKEFERLGLEAILDLADLVEDESLPCAQVVPASQLTPVVYARLGATPLSQEALRSGVFYPRS
jgi:hypothetical protein